jgi:hypothetical protein
MTAMTTHKRRPAPQIARHGYGPEYWMHETSGRLEAAIWALLEDEPLNDEQIAIVRAYLRQWIMAPVWHGPPVAGLRRRIDELTSTAAIRRWLDDALSENIDPL